MKILRKIRRIGTQSLGLTLPSICSSVMPWIKEGADINIELIVDEQTNQGFIKITAINHVDTAPTKKDLFVQEVVKSAEAFTMDSDILALSSPESEQNSSVGTLEQIQKELDDTYGRGCNHEYIHIGSAVRTCVKCAKKEEEEQ